MLFLLTLLFTYSFNVSALHAQSLLITDCQGFTRAVKTVDQGTTSKVEVNVSGASGQQPQIVLTEVATGITQTATVIGGVAVFENVPPGVFEISTTTEGLKVGFIDIVGASFSTAATTGAAAGAILVGGGAATGIGVAIDDASKGNSSPASPTPQPTPQPTIQPTAVPTPVPTSPPTCADCDPEAVPPTVEPFEPPPDTDFSVLSPYR